MSWFYLVLAGLFEAGWLIFLEKSASFSKPPFVFLACGSMAISLYLFALSVKDIEVAIAYMVWLGVGVCSLIFFNHVFLGSTVSLMQGIFMLLLFIAIIGLKVSS
ncbi:SMR family transporter [Pseudoalteromonas sp. MMG022]|uniref:DMT family transporter n=1 Tax=Pseudoalteromonas sp. MMG022 TaxID=2909978 RepID=UPI001F031645|nr:SMR family transporter [Pseudoalteromonas sp. MMG022]MCF6437606.1 SMR family transporter [Pseudoalteromonas sp. MMG022]